MRLERKQDEEIAKRKGMSGRTLVAIIWLILSFGGAYLLARFIFESGILSPNLFRDAISDFGNMALKQAWRRSDIPVWVGWGVMIFILYMLMQVVFFMGFAIASPEGRRKGGEPSMYSRNKDPFDDR